MFSYAGISLADPENSDVGPWIESNIRPAELFPLAHRTWPSTLTGPVLDATPEPIRPVRIGTLWWPWGASRFAQAHFVVSEKQLDIIRQLVNLNYEFLAKTLVIDDGGSTVETEMWMLPARPLSTAVTGAGMYLLTLVDDRYYWWQKPLDLTLTAGTTTWDDLYDTIGAALGTAIAADPIAGAYGLPTIDYQAHYQLAPPVLDAVAWSVGQRIVRALDGTVTAQGALTAAASVTARLALYGLKKYAGGAFALTP